MKERARVSGWVVLVLVISMNFRQTIEGLLHMHFVKFPGRLNNLNRKQFFGEIEVIPFRLKSSSGNSIGVWLSGFPNDDKDVEVGRSHESEVLSGGESGGRTQVGLAFSRYKCDKVILFIHGQMATRAQPHRKEGMEFLSRNFQACVVTYDPSGYADSTGWPDSLSLKKDAESVLLWITMNFSDSRRSRLPVFVWGHSMGGPIAAHLGAISSGNLKPKSQKFPGSVQMESDGHLGSPEQPLGDAILINPFDNLKNDLHAMLKNSVRGVVQESTFSRLSDPALNGIYSSPLQIFPESWRQGIFDFLISSGALDSTESLTAIRDTNFQVLFESGRGEHQDRDSLDDSVIVRKAVGIFFLHGDSDWTVPVRCMDHSLSIVKSVSPEIKNKFPDIDDLWGKVVQTLVVPGGHHNTLHTSKHQELVSPRISQWMIDVRLLVTLIRASEIKI